MKECDYVPNFWSLFCNTDLNVSFLQDNCPYIFNQDQNDVDNDGIGDVCDLCNFTDPNNPVDRDNDGVDDICYNCPQRPNTDQENHDDDETGDACDPEHNY